MASWLKAAEDLFEVVDRRAKHVVSELANEQSDSHTPAKASNGEGSQPKRRKSKLKVQKKLSETEAPQPTNNVEEPSHTQTSVLDPISDKDQTSPSTENDRISSNKLTTQTSTEQQQIGQDDVFTPPSSETLTNKEVQLDTNHVEGPPVVTDGDGELNEKTSVIPAEDPSLQQSPKEMEMVNGEPKTDAADESMKSGDAEASSKINEERSQSPTSEVSLNSKSTFKDPDVKVESQVSQAKKEEHKAETTPAKIQEQLDEAQGLLKTAISTGQSKEARLARVCAGLSTRLQEYKSENAQLEELLIAERELSKSYEARIKQLQHDLSVSKTEIARVEANMVDALAAKNSEIESLVSSVETLKRQAASSEGDMASLQAHMDSIMRNRELTETRMMQALREELSSAERRAEEERAAHNATKMASMKREVELEQRAVEASTALARIQRMADERTAKATELEQKVALLEVECATLSQELQDMEAHVVREQKKSPEDINQVKQMQALQEELDRARQGQRDAEGKVSSLEAELQKTRVEMAAMKRDAEHYSRQEHMELEKRYRELTDLLYYKQTQLESMASEKAAAEFQLEKELKRLQEAQVEAERSRVSRRPSTSWEEEDSEMKALEPLPLYHRHMATASIQLQKAAKLLDKGAARATRFLWRYPTARLILLFYLVFVHLFLMYLLHHLQEQADNLSAREVAESMGLANHTLP